MSLSNIMARIADHFKNDRMSTQWDRQVRELVESLDRDIMKKIKIMRHTNKEKNSDVIVMLPAEGFEQDAQFFKFEGVTTTIVQEIVEDQETGKCIEVRWRLETQFTDRLSPSSEPRAVRLEATEAMQKWIEEDRKFQKRKAVRVIRINRRNETWSSTEKA